jgi:hypothetical protein
VRLCGPLQTFSAYPFENNLGWLKKRIRGSTKPLVQLTKRLAEMENLSQKKIVPSSLPKKKECYTFGEKCIVIDSVDKERKRVDGKVYSLSGNLFTSPCLSSRVGIHTTSMTDFTEMHLPFSDLQAKAVFIEMKLIEPGRNDAVVSKLVHSL